MVYALAVVVSKVLPASCEGTSENSTTSSLSVREISEAEVSNEKDSVIATAAIDVLRFEPNT